MSKATTDMGFYSTGKVTSQPSAASYKLTGDKRLLSERPKMVLQSLGEEMFRFLSIPWSQVGDAEMGTDGGCTCRGVMSELRNPKFRKSWSFMWAGRKPIPTLPQIETLFLLSQSGNKYALFPEESHYLHFPRWFAIQMS